MFVGKHFRNQFQALGKASGETGSEMLPQELSSLLRVLAETRKTGVLCPGFSHSRDCQTHRLWKVFLSPDSSHMYTQSFSPFLVPSWVWLQALPGRQGPDDYPHVRDEQSMALRGHTLLKVTRPRLQPAGAQQAQRCLSPIALDKALFCSPLVLQWCPRDHSAQATGKSWCNHLDSGVQLLRSPKMSKEKPPGVSLLPLLPSAHLNRMQFFHGVGDIP